MKNIICLIVIALVGGCVTKEKTNYLAPNLTHGEIAKEMAATWVIRSESDPSPLGEVSVFEERLGLKYSPAGEPGDRLSQSHGTYLLETRANNSPWEMDSRGVWSVGEPTNMLNDGSYHTCIWFNQDDDVKEWRSFRESLGLTPDGSWQWYVDDLTKDSFTVVDSDRGVIFPKPLFFKREI